MKQILHIFAKDARHRWVEIVASIALLSFHAWYVVRSWSHPEEYGAAFGMGSVSGIFARSFLSGLVSFLLPLVWAFMVVRIVQDESLVGDRQFWVTRPFEWPKLLLAKVLFVIAFINVPIFVVQVVLLSKAEFLTGHNVVSLLDFQLVNLGLLLPVFAFAVVTATIAQFGLALLCLVLYIIGFTYLATQVPGASFGEILWNIDLFVVLIAAVAIVALQYARRWTALSRWILVGLAALFTLMVAVFPYRAYLNQEYPALKAGESAPLQLALGPPPKPDENQYGYAGEDEVFINLPVETAGIQPEAIIAVKGQSISLEGPAGGVYWNSSWQRNGTDWYAEPKQAVIAIRLDRKTYDRFANNALHMKLTLAFAEYRDEDKRPYVIPEGVFDFPEVGRCGRRPNADMLRCFATVLPHSLLIAEDLSANTCPKDKDVDAPDPGTHARQWWSDKSGSSALGISPVVLINVYPYSPFSLDSISQRRVRRGGICAGTPVTLSHPREQYKKQVEFDLGTVRLADYAPKPRRLGR